MADIVISINKTAQRGKYFKEARCENVSVLFKNLNFSFIGNQKINYSYLEQEKAVQRYVNKYVLSN